MAPELVKKYSNRRSASPDNDNSSYRKRRLNGDSESKDVKRSYNMGDGTFNMKLLVSNNVAGAIIGKGGETMHQLQKDHGIRLHVGKLNECFPGTNERAVLITGSQEGIQETVDYIIEKILLRNADDEPNPEVEMKILVPNSTAGKIIGKAGGYIRQLKEDSGCQYLNVSHKNNDGENEERIVSLVGKRSEAKTACSLILEKIIEDPQSGSCPSVSYSGGGGGGGRDFGSRDSGFGNRDSFGGGRDSFSRQQSLPAFASPFNSQMGQAGNLANNVVAALQQSLALSGMTQPPPPPNSSDVNLCINLSSAGQSNNLNTISQLLDRIKMQLRTCGLTEMQVMEICASLTVLAKYGILGIGIGGMNPLSALQTKNRVMDAIGRILEECLVAKTPQSSMVDAPFESANTGRQSFGGDRNDRQGGSRGHQGGGQKRQGWRPSK